MESRIDTYTVRFNPKRINENLTSGTQLRIINGKEIIDGKFSEKAMPNTRTTIAVRKEFPTYKPSIQITQEVLDKIVKYFNLIDPVKDEIIQTAKLDYGMDAFWNHPELYREIDNKGIVLKVCKDQPETTPIDYFWLAVMKADQDFYVKEEGSRRPESLSDVKFIVEKKSDSNNQIKTSYSTLTEAKDTVRAIVKLTRNRKMFIIDNLGDNLYDPKSSSDDHLENIILESLDKYPEKRVENGMKFSEFVAQVCNETEDSFEILNNVKFAISKGLVEKSGDMYYYDNKPLGNVQKDVEQYFLNSENKKALVNLQLQINKLKKST